VLARVEHGLVLDEARDDVLALLDVHLRHALEREVDRSVEPDVNTISLAMRRSAGDLRARLLDRLLAFQPKAWLRLAALPKSRVK
jgi:hypothetical protein